MALSPEEQKIWENSILDFHHVSFSPDTQLARDHRVKRAAHYLICGGEISDEHCDYLDLVQQISHEYMVDSGVVNRVLDKVMMEIADA